MASDIATRVSCAAPGPNTAHSARAPPSTDGARNPARAPSHALHLTAASRAQAASHARAH
ncbi:hypothetical protein BUC_6768 [Burkholderia pseudomallei 576]|nr:hypothetical protein BUC_6768 [Burkholderia pseudomallei 576]